MMRTFYAGLSIALAGLAAVACGATNSEQSPAGLTTDGTLAQPDCPDYQFPLAEPAYNAKRQRDLTPFARALSDLTVERRVALDGLVMEATIPSLQGYMVASELTAVELVTYYIDRIARYDIGRLNAVMALNPDALSIATALDAERAAGRARGPLHGVPVLIKDNIATVDPMSTTAGAYALRDWRADRDAYLVHRLREAGAVILGKANMSEWANYIDPCLPNGFSALGGQTQNPYGPFDPSGSSSGSAVAVAANLAGAAIGSETQGSIIWPARDNSLAGLKTSLGLVSRDYIVPLVDHMDVPGPLGRSVTDVAVLLTAITGVDANDPATSAAARLSGEDFTRYLSLAEARKLRIGVLRVPRSAIDAAITAQEKEVGHTLTQEERAALADLLQEAQGVAAIVAAFEAQGVETVVIEQTQTDLTEAPDVRPVLEYGFRDSFDRFAVSMGPAFPVRSLAGVSAINAADPANRAPYGYRFIQGSLATSVTAEEYASLVERNRTEAQSRLRTLMHEHGVDVITGAVGQSYAAAGFPALAVPNGVDASGHPLGVVFVGDFLSEPQLIAAGFVFEQARQGRVVPGVATATNTP